MDEEASQNKSGKAANLESLTKEELVAKCKSLITFLKKAKTAKDDAVVENNKLKSEHAKVIRQFEEERNKIEREIETMQEVVASSTESKMMIVTKNESLQRQLNLQLSEVEGMKQLVDSFTEEKEAHLRDINKLRLLTTTQQKVVEQLKGDREKLLQINQTEIAWQEERTSLIDKIETLESQVEQSEILKTKCKKLLSERDDALKKLNEIYDQQRNSSFEKEKMAMEIVQNELKSQNIILEEKCKNYLKEKDELIIKLSELEKVVGKLQPTEDQLSKCRMELDSANDLLNDVSKKYENSCLTIKILEGELERKDEVQSKQRDELDKLKLCATYEVKIDELKENLDTSENACKEDSDLKAKLDKLYSENRDYSSEIEDLRKENKSLKYFQTSVNSIFSIVGMNDANKCTLDIENSLTKLKDTLSLYNELSKSSLKLANLVSNLFCFQILMEETVSLDAIIQGVNVSYSNFEKYFYEFKESNLQEICNSCSLSIKNYCFYVDKLDNLLINNTTSPENCDLLLEGKNLSMQFKNLFHNFQKICDILSNLFNFNLAPEVGEIIKITDDKNKLLENFILKSLSNLSHVTNLEKLLKSSSEEINSYKSLIEERDKTVNSLELNLKSLKDDIDEIQKLKFKDEETISSINKNYELLKGQQKFLEEKLQKESEDIEQYKEENSELNKERHTFKSEVEYLKLQLTEITKANASELEEQRKRIELLEKEKECLIEENKSRDYEKSHETAKIESLIQETVNLRSVLESLQLDKQTLEEELKSSNFEITKLLKDKKDLDEENEKVKTDCGKLSELNISYKEHITTIEEENIVLSEEISKLRKRIQENAEKEVSLNSNIENLNSELERLREEKASICNELNISYKEQVSTLEEGNNALREEIMELRKQIQEYLEKEMSVNSNIENANSELERLRKEKASLCNEFNEMKNQLQELKLASEDVSKLKDDYHILEQQKKSQDDKLKESVQRSEKIKGEFEVLKGEHESVLNKFEAYERELKESHQQNSYLSETCNNLEKSLKEFENIKQKYDDINEENEKSKLKLKSLSEQVEDQQNVKKTLEESLNITSLECNKLNNINEKLEEEIENLKSKIVSYELKITDYDRTKEEFEQVSKDRDILKEIASGFEAELSEVKNFNKNLEDQLTQVNDHLISLRDEKEALQSNVKTLEAKVLGCVQSIKSWPDKDVTESQTVHDIAANSLEVENSNKAASRDASTKYTEVISELNDMLQIIRKRGEKISLLEDEIRQKDHEIEDLKVKLEEAGRKLCSGEKELASKHEELQKMQLSSKNEEDSTVVDLKVRITDLEEENLQLRKTVEQEGPTKPAISADAQSEVMSTSTISKMEESCRMKEVEDTFEERYLKLKNLAIKLKKKLLEQTAEFKALEESKRNLLAEKEEMAKKGQSHIISKKNIQALQSEIDKLNDNLDAKIKELKEREKQLVVSAQEISELKSKLAQLEEDNGGLIMTIKNTEESWIGQKTLNESLQGQVAALEKRLTVEEKKIVKGQEEREGLEAKLEEEKNVIEQLTKELEELRQDNKKHSLIDLEMKDYERSIEELTSLVKEKDDALTTMKNKLVTEEIKVTNLSDEISLLKEQVENETERAEKHKKTSSDYKEKLSQIRSEQETHMKEKEKDREMIEGLNQELEKQKLCLAELSAQSSKTERQLRKEKDLAENKVEILEENLQKNEKLIGNLKEELQELQKQFEAYKVRAQNVLKQKNKIPQQNYEDLKSEKEELQTDLEASQLKTHKLQAELTAAQAELGFLNSEKDKLSQNLSNLSTEFAKKESLLESKIESLQKKFESKSADYQLIIADMSAQTEAMNKSFKAQLESEKERHQSEVRKLEERLEESEDKLWQLKNNSLPAAKHSGTGKLEVVENPSASLAAHHTRKVSYSVGAIIEEHRIDVANMIRGEGEGSEWVEPQHPNRSPSQHLYNPPTLEQLINNPFPSQSQQQRLSLDDSTSVISATTDFSVKEIAKLEYRLSASDNRIQQLTALLNESEAENARLVQLSDTLKEEIRRTSRNVNREKHLENNEYLKNVVLKFVTLKTGDEKFRLVPVLKTLLQLSPEEANNIAFIAKGEDTQNTPQGWGNYLHLWSGR